MQLGRIYTEVLRYSTANWFCRADLNSVLISWLAASHRLPELQVEIASLLQLTAAYSIIGDFFNQALRSCLQNLLTALFGYEGWDN